MRFAASASARVIVRPIRQYWRSKAGPPNRNRLRFGESFQGLKRLMFGIANPLAGEE